MKSENELYETNEYLKESNTPEDMPKALSEYEAVAGSESDDFYYDHDWGFFLLFWHAITTIGF